MTDFIENSNHIISSNEDLELIIQSFNSKVNSVYSEYCDQDGNSILVNPELPGYANIIYHLYTTGVISYCPGGKDYKSEYKKECYGEKELSNSRRLCFSFGIKKNFLNESCVILPIEKCIEFRKEMERIIQVAQSSGYLSIININEMIEQLNTEVIKASMMHYPEGKYEAALSTLIKPKESPNSNTIYKLYSDGSITYEKGGDAYGCRTVFNSEAYLDNVNKYHFRFSDKFITSYGLSSVLLEYEECKKFRKQMQELILLFENSKDN